MTYRHYIATTKKNDSMETFREYLSKHNYIYKMENPKMQEQHAKASYGMRFAIQYK